MRVEHNENLNRKNVLSKAKSELKTYSRSLMVFSLVGLGLSLYAYRVEMTLDTKDAAKPFCDINEHVSCTKVFGSEYGKGFGLFNKGSFLYQPNSAFGIVFYTMLAYFANMHTPVAVNGSLILIICSNFISLYLAYVLYFILKDLCIVCIGTYLVNVLNLIFITKKSKKVKEINELLNDTEWRLDLTNKLD